jgi:hypothetical protein
MCTHGNRLNHGTIIKRHSLRKHNNSVLIRDEIVLSHTISLESLDAEILAHIVLASLARTAFTAHKLWATCHIISRFADFYIRADSNNLC